MGTMDKNDLKLTMDCGGCSDRVMVFKVMYFATH